MKSCFLILAVMLSAITAAAAPQEAIALKLGDAEPRSRELNAFNSNLLMATALHGFNYGGPEFGNAIKELRPGGLRFPGGTTANNYLWREDSFSLQKEDKTEWAAKQLEIFRKIGRKYDLPGYARLCKEYGLTPIYVLNVYEEIVDTDETNNVDAHLQLHVRSRLQQRATCRSF